MAFPTDWGRKASVTIDNTQVSGSGDHTNFVFQATPANLPSEMFDADGSFPALSGGGDIRFSSDAAGSTQLDLDVDFFTIDNDPANGTASLWVRIPTLDFNDDTVIYVWYDKTGETQPAVGAAFGRNAVWQDYEFASHDGATDVTGNGTITQSGTTTTTGPFGNSAGAVRGSSNDHATSDQTFAEINEPYTIQAWGHVETNSFTRLINLADASSTSIQATVGTNFGSSQGGTIQAWGSSNITTSTSGEQGLSTWRSYSGVYAADNDRLLDINGGSATATSTTAVTMTGMDRLRLLRTADSSASGNQPISAAEARFRLDALSSDWIATEYNNQSAPGTFASAGTPETPSGGPSSSLLLMQQSFRQ